MLKSIGKLDPLQALVEVMAKVQCLKILRKHEGIQRLVELKLEVKELKV